MRHPKITIEPMVEIDGKLTGYMIAAEQHGLTLTLGEVRRRLVPEEPVEDTLARACQKAADWCAAGPIDLRDAGRLGMFASTART